MKGGETGDEGLLREGVQQRLVAGLPGKALHGVATQPAAAAPSCSMTCNIWQARMCV